MIYVSNYWSFADYHHPDRSANFTSSLHLHVLMEEGLTIIYS